MKLSVWAKSQGLQYKSVWKMWKAGKLPIPSEQLPTGTIIVHPPVTATEGVVALYARVSSADQKADLDRQVARLAVFAAEHGWRVTEVVKEIGSGLNGHRRGLMRLLRTPTLTTVVVEHRDRLMRFGFEYVESALAAQGRTLVVVDTTEVQDDLVRDMTEVLTSGSRYSLVKSSGVYLLRANVQTHCGPPRPTRFRREWASLNKWLDPLQLSFLQNSESLPADKLCGLIVVTAYRDKQLDQSSPAFLGLGIPNQNLSNWYVLKPVNSLLAQYHDIETGQHTPQEIPVTIKDRAMPRLKKSLNRSPEAEE